MWNRSNNDLYSSVINPQNYLVTLKEVLLLGFAIVGCKGDLPLSFYLFQKCYPDVTETCFFTLDCPFPGIVIGEPGCVPGHLYYHVLLPVHSILPPQRALGTNNITKQFSNLIPAFEGVKAIFTEFQSCFQFVLNMQCKQAILILCKQSSALFFENCQNRFLTLTNFRTDWKPKMIRAWFLVLLLS